MAEGGATMKLARLALLVLEVSMVALPVVILLVLAGRAWGGAG